MLVLDVCIVPRCDDRNRKLTPNAPLEKGLHEFISPACG